MVYVVLLQRKVKKRISTQEYNNKDLPHLLYKLFREPCGWESFCDKGQTANMNSRTGLSMSLLLDSGRSLKSLLAETKRRLVFKLLLSNIFTHKIAVRGICMCLCACVCACVLLLMLLECL